MKSEHETKPTTLDTDPDEMLLPSVPLAKPKGNTEMLRLIAYDIADPKRLARVADVCEDYGVRVQYSLFECWLEEPEFQELWNRLKNEIDEEKDRIVMYLLDSGLAKKRMSAGETMILTQPTNFYLV